MSNCVWGQKWNYADDDFQKIENISFYAHLQFNLNLCDCFDFIFDWGLFGNDGSSEKNPQNHTNFLSDQEASIKNHLQSLKMTQYSMKTANHIK